MEKWCGAVPTASCRVKFGVYGCGRLLHLQLLNSLAWTCHTNNNYCSPQNSRRELSSIARSPSFVLRLAWHLAKRGWAGWLAGGKNIMIVQNFCSGFKWCSQITAQHFGFFVSLWPGVLVKWGFVAFIAAVTRIDCILSDGHRKKAFKSLISFWEPASQPQRILKWTFSLMMPAAYMCAGWLRLGF